MRINRAIGLIIFLIVAKIIFSVMFSAFEDTATASLRTIEASAIVVQQKLNALK